MPLTKKGEKILHAMQREYGSKKGKQVFYASENAGTIHGVHHKGASVHTSWLAAHKARHGIK